MLKDQSIDVAALYGALDSRRHAQRLSWRKLASELGLSPSVFTRLAQGHSPDLDNYVVMTGWLGVSADDFIFSREASEKQGEDTVAKISGYLRADKRLKSQSAMAIAKIVETAYEEMVEK